MTAEVKARNWAVILVLIGISVALDQYIHWGEWFTMDQIHHETFVTALFFGAICLVTFAYRKKVFGGRGE